MFNVKEINEAINGKILYNNNKIVDTISINSKEIKNNTLFIPIIGEKYDANNFILDAIKNGCIASLISSNYEKKEEIVSECKNNNITLIEVSDTLKALQDLAHYNRIKNKNTKVIAITGSNGKTTTKEIVYNTLKNKYNVLKTEGNLNNHIGLPLTLLKLNKHDVCVLEMGMNHFGEIEVLSKIAEPDMAIITNIGTAHIGILGSKDNILKAKMEITSGLKENGILFINNNDEYLNKINLNTHYTICRYGFDNNIKLFNDKDRNIIFFNGKKVDVSKVGEYPINAVLAYYIAKQFNINFNEFKKSIKTYQTPKMRNEKIKIKNNIIINDSYNANYDSMKSGIEKVIQNYSDKNYNLLLYLGDMLELGEWSKFYHEEIGKLINNSKINMLYVTGNEIKYILKEINNPNINVKEFKSNENKSYIVDEIINELDKHKKNVIYFKGSRAIGLDKIVEELLIKLNNR